MKTPTFRYHFPRGFWWLVVTIIALDQSSALSIIVAIYSGIHAAYHLEQIRRLFIKDED